MFVQRGEVSVVDGHVNMLTASACRKRLVLVRMILHLAGHIRTNCAGMHGSKKPGALAARKKERERGGERRRDYMYETLFFVESLFFNWRISENGYTRHLYETLLYENLKTHETQRQPHRKRVLRVES